MNDVVHAAMTPEKARELIQELKAEAGVGEEAKDEN